MYSRVYVTPSSSRSVSLSAHNTTQIESSIGCGTTEVRMPSAVYVTNLPMAQGLYHEDRNEHHMYQHEP